MHNEFFQDCDFRSIYETYRANAMAANVNNDYDGYGGGRNLDDLDCGYYQQFSLSPYTELGLEENY